MTFNRVQDILDKTINTHKLKLERLTKSSKQTITDCSTKENVVINFSSQPIFNELQWVLSRALNFAPTPRKVPVEAIITSLEETITRNKVPPHDADCLRQDIARNNDSLGEVTKAQPSKRGTECLTELTKELGCSCDRGGQRWWWVLCLLLLFGSAVCVVVVTVQRFLTNPTYLAHEEKMDTGKPFPSVLVCPAIIFPDCKVHAFIKRLNIPPNITTSFIKKNLYQLAAFFSPDVSYHVPDLENLQHLLACNNITLDEAGRSLTPTCEETLLRCRWAGMIVNCSELFELELTGDGYCCVFNARSLRREKEKGVDHKIYRTKFSGFASGLMLAINHSESRPIDVDLEYVWLALQSSRHFVESTNNGTPLSHGTEQWSVYHVRRYQIQNGAHVFSDQLKRCRMKDHPLRFFPVYHKRYCVVECEIAHSMRMCNCVRPVFPVPPGGQYCHAHNLRCAYQASQSYGNDACGCANACDVETNFIEKISYPLDPVVRPLDPFYEGLDFHRTSIVRVFFQNRKLKIKSRRFSLYILDLFAELGGVFGVFFGCSVLTLLELGILCKRALSSTYRRPRIEQNYTHKEEKAESQPNIK